MSVTAAAGRDWCILGMFGRRHATKPTRLQLPPLISVLFFVPK